MTVNLKRNKYFFQNTVLAMLAMLAGVFLYTENSLNVGVIIYPALNPWKTGRKSEGHLSLDRFPIPVTLNRLC